MARARIVRSMAPMRSVKSAVAIGSESALARPPFAKAPLILGIWGKLLLISSNKLIYLNNRKRKSKKENQKKENQKKTSTKKNGFFFVLLMKKKPRRLTLRSKRGTRLGVVRLVLVNIYPRAQGRRCSWSHRGEVAAPVAVGVRVGLRVGLGCCV
jgi:hypothetical protein